MCDTLVATGNSTFDGNVLLAKNSDRDANEAHQLLLVPEARHDDYDAVDCTYIQIPQVRRTNQVFLAKPFWIWGAEMGTNQHGVAIGNEAIFTKSRQNCRPGLIGMDLLRLGLERASNAFQALEVITSLIEAYGQSGDCGYSHPFYYQNSFLIADRQEAWVLETIDHQWAAIQVKDVYSISNAYTIQEEWDLASTGLITYARKMGWYKKGEQFNFKTCFSDKVYTRFSAADKRRKFTMAFLNEKQGKITPAEMSNVLRSHFDEKKEGWSPDRALLGQDICMHAGFGPVRINQTVGSLISHLSADGDTHWVTGTSAPCLSLFKPVWMDTGLPDVGHNPGQKYDHRQLWWRHERYHRRLLRNYPAVKSAISEELQTLQKEFFEKENQLDHKNNSHKSALSAYTFNCVESFYEKWLEKLNAIQSARITKYHSLYWNAIDKKAGFERVFLNDTVVK